MEVLVQWFSHHLAQFISPEGAVFIISMIPILELRGGLLAASLLNIGCKGTADLYRGKYHSDSVYPAFYPADL